MRHVIDTTWRAALEEFRKKLSHKAAAHARWEVEDALLEGDTRVADGVGVGTSVATYLAISSAADEEW